MLIVWLALLGILIFAAAAWIAGAWLRRHPTKDNAERLSRVMHAFFFAALIAPGAVAMFYPGLSRLDPLLGLHPLPWRPFFLVLGIVLAVPGIYLMAVTNRLVRSLGRGANAFRLTRRIVSEDIYARTRNPMSLGYYLLGLALALIVGSTFAALGVLLGIIPAHLFFLRYFEEYELGLRFGDSYRLYKQRTPFLFPRLAASTQEAR